MVAMVVHELPRHDGYQCADIAGRGKEEVRMYYLHSVVDEGRDYTANHPCTAQRTDNQQYDNGGRYPRDIIGNGYLIILPGNPVTATPINTQAAAVVSKTLTSAVQCVTAKVRMVKQSY